MCRIMYVVKCCLFSCVLLQLCSAQNLNCTITHYADRTFYNVSDGSRVFDVKESNCPFSWANGTDHVLAHQSSRDPDLVMDSNINHLITSKCFQIILFKRHCPSEGTDYTANCITNCTLTSLGTSQETKESPTVGITVAVLLLVGLFFVLLSALCYKCRKRIPGYAACISRRLYTSPVKL
ncbi:uncharacterized protein LOC115027434 isoform X2 [Cottoperca gobio]|uniref:Uncharacterized protein LOC115027434 isoform X2 n=1 Tax=Cottoperca gobio TaxID=56716 RepID=A0A6J2S093_COTGO|nr:uncharacterized protein LOC115027434 isoform X2 [Cottoperca gobio]